MCESKKAGKRGRGRKIGDLRKTDSNSQRATATDRWQQAETVAETDQQLFTSTESSKMSLPKERRDLESMVASADRSSKTSCMVRMPLKQNDPAETQIA